MLVTKAYSIFHSLAMVAALGGAVQSARAWSESECPFRRSIDLTLEPPRITGEESAMFELLAPGLLDPKNGSDLRIETEDGKAVAMRVIKNNEDDRAQVLFNPIKGRQKYFIYWGGKLDEKRAATTEVKQIAGLLAEMKHLGGGPMDTADRIKKIWNESGDVQARAIFSQLFLGYNPALINYPSIGKITGTLYAPIDGSYEFALSADDRGVVFLDGDELVFARGPVGRARFNKTLDLKRGPHALEYYHIDAGGDWMVSLVWKRPDTQQLEPIASDSFGKVVWCKTGKLEQKEKLLTADFDLNWQGETIASNQSTYRLNFESAVTDKKENVQISWDFGDGQTATGGVASHVFLRSGKYAIKCSAKTDRLSDSKTVNITIGRDPQNMINPSQDLPERQASIVKDYDLSKLDNQQQVAALRLLTRAKFTEPAIKCLGEICRQNKLAEPDQAYDAIVEAIEQAEANKKIAELADALSKLSPQSNLLPKAADLPANVLLWKLADFNRAVDYMQKLTAGDSRNIRRLRMQAMLLNNQVEQARKELAGITEDPEAGKRTALSGAYARSVEYYIRNKELESADETWETWQRRFPADFLEGYSMVLKVRILESSYPQAAAKAAEAFAIAVPESAYAPELLDRASKILEKLNPEKSKSLRKMLKEKYPEDPLSQDKPSQDHPGKK